MAHVTVVEVEESLLKTFSEEAALRQGDDAFKADTQHKQDCRVCQSIVTQDGLCQCLVPQMRAKVEFLFVNLNKLQQSGVAHTANMHANSQDIPKIHTSRELFRKPNIINQNVGVTGSVFMVSDPSCQQVIDTSDDESDSSLTSSVSSLSESDSGLSSNVEVSATHNATTITIGDKHGPHNNRVLLYIGASTTEESNPAETHEHISQDDLQEVVSLPSTEPQVTDDSTDKTLILEWRVIAHPSPTLQHPLPPHQEGDRGSTPTSFSSAYTVTEHESTSEDSETSRHNWLGQESEEESQDISRASSRLNPDGVSVTVSEADSLSWRDEDQGLQGTDDSDPPTNTTSDRHSVADTTSNRIKGILSGVGSNWQWCELRGKLHRFRRTSDSSNSSSGESSIVYNYIPCRDQREKEEEELWVANEAAEPGGGPSFQGVAPPLWPPLWGWDCSLGGAGKQELAHHGPVWAEQLRAPHDCVTSPCLTTLMCTLAPSLGAPVTVGVDTATHKHYSTRQRVAEAKIIKIVDEEPKYTQNWNRLSCETQIPSEDVILQTSTTTNMPTKRFSFLIRSNSVKQESVVTDPNSVPATRQPVSPSDQAILDKLATLNIEAPGVVLKPRTRCSLFEPPCVRCGEPVYLQERTEPTLRLVYHSSCFKCHKCGVRLTLKTFYRSPLDSKDSRVFCRSHVPSLDPGRLDPSRPDNTSKTSPDKTTPDPHSQTSRKSNNSGDNTCVSLQDELDIVKCDTIGLRYF